MAATRHPSRRPLLTACACSLLCGACLPIAHTVTLSPAIAGTYRHEDGTPVTGAPLALSTAYNDSTCASPSLRTTTDAAGGFAFPATRHRQRYVLLLPYDAIYEYTICGGEPATSTLHSTSYMHGVPASAYVTCTRLAVPEPTTRRRTHCTSSRRPGEDRPALGPQRDADTGRVRSFRRTALPSGAVQSISRGGAAKWAG